MKKWFYILPALWSVVIYLNTLGHEYALDDKAIITENRFTQAGIEGIAGHFTHSYWYGMNGKDEGIYRPVSGATFSIEHALFGNNPGLSHLINVLLYGLLLLVIWQWLASLRLLRLEWLWLGVMLFAVHPVHTEVVANIKSRDELLALLFTLLSFISFARWMNGKSKKWLVLSVLTYILALLSKETALALLPVFPVLAWHHGQSMKQIIKSSIAPVVAAGAYLLLYTQVTEVLDEPAYHLFDNSLVQEAPAGALLATKWWILGDYIRLLVFPDPLVYDYSFNTVPLARWASWRVLGSLILVGMICIGTIVLLTKRSSEVKKNAGWMLALAFLVLPLLPVSNMFFLIGSTMAERFLFAPSLGFAMTIALSGNALIRSTKNGENIIIALSLPILLVFSAMTVERNKAWKDDETLFAHDLPYLKMNAKAHHNLANIYHDHGSAALHEAERVTYYETAIRLLEDAISIHAVPEFYKQLGELYGNLGKWDGVVKAHSAYLEMDNKNPVVWNQLGIAYGMQSELEEALRCFSRACELAPKDAEALNNRAKTLAMLRRTYEAIEQYEALLELFPDHAEAQAMLQDLRNEIIVRTF